MNLKFPLNTKLTLITLDFGIAIFRVDYLIKSFQLHLTFVSLFEFKIIILMIYILQKLQNISVKVGQTSKMRESIYMGTN